MLQFSHYRKIINNYCKAWHPEEGRASNSINQAETPPERELAGSLYPAVTSSEVTATQLNVASKQLYNHINHIDGQDIGLSEDNYTIPNFNAKCILVLTPLIDHT